MKNVQFNPAKANDQHDQINDDCIAYKMKNEGVGVREYLFDHFRQGDAQEDKDDAV